MRVTILRASIVVRTSDLRRFVYVGILAMLGACSRQASPNTEVAQSAPAKVDIAPNQTAPKVRSAPIAESPTAGETPQSIVASASGAPKSYNVFAVLDHRGTHYELSDEPVTTCVHLKGEDRWDWKLAWIVGRWTGTVKSCWRKQHYEKRRVESNFQSDSEKTIYVTVPAHDEIIVCLPYAREKGASEVSGPACQNIDPAYFTAVDSLPRAAF